MSLSKAIIEDALTAVERDPICFIHSADDMPAQAVIIDMQWLRDRPHRPIQEILDSMHHTHLSPDEQGFNL